MDVTIFAVVADPGEGPGDVGSLSGGGGFDVGSSSGDGFFGGAAVVSTLSSLPLFPGVDVTEFAVVADPGEGPDDVGSSSGGGFFGGTVVVSV